MPGVTGPAKVPITCSVAYSGEGIYNNETVNIYSLQVSSSNGSAINNVSLTPTTGSYISLNEISVAASGKVQLYVYVPTTDNGTVNVTASATGYENNVIPVQSAPCPHPPHPNEDESSD